MWVSGRGRSIYIYIYMYVYIYIYVYVYMCIYIYIFCNVRSHAFVLADIWVAACISASCDKRVLHGALHAAVWLLIALSPKSGPATDQCTRPWTWLRRPLPNWRVSCACSGPKRSARTWPCAWWRPWASPTWTSLRIHMRSVWLLARQLYAKTSMWRGWMSRSGTDRAA